MNVFFKIFFRLISFCIFAELELAPSSSCTAGRMVAKVSQGQSLHLSG